MTTDNQPPYCSLFAMAPQNIASDMPETKEFRVLRLSYGKLTKRHSPSILHVTYHCDTRAINEVVCIEHGSVVRVQAAKWWKQRTNITMPRSCDEVIAMASQLAVPSAIKVRHLNRAYPTIVEYSFSTIN